MKWNNTYEIWETSYNIDQHWLFFFTSRNGILGSIAPFLFCLLPGDL